MSFSGSRFRLWQLVLLAVAAGVVLPVQGQVPKKGPVAPPPKAPVPPGKAPVGPKMPVAPGAVQPTSPKTVAPSAPPGKKVQNCRSPKMSPLIRRMACQSKPPITLAR